MDNRQAEFEISSKKYFEREKAISEIDIELEQAETVLWTLINYYELYDVIDSKEQLLKIELGINNIRVLLRVIDSSIQNSRRIAKDSIDKIN